MTSVMPSRCESTKDLFAYAVDNRPSIVYVATNSINGKRYIGLTRLTLSKRRQTHFLNARRDHGHHNQALYAAIRKYSESAFVFSVLAECESYKAACVEERRLIQKLRPEYNLTMGGEGVLGHRHDNKTRAKMSTAAKKRGAPWIQGQCPSGVREKLAASARARKGTIKLTEAQKARRRRILLISNAARKMPVVCVTHGLAFECAADAAIFYGLADAMSISNYCKGRQAHSGGLVFAYAEEWWK